MICFAAIAPHPPILVPGIGQENDLMQIKDTTNAMEKLGKMLTEAKPDTVVVISPHAPLHPQSFGMNSSPRLEGSFSRFGLERSYAFENDKRFAERMYDTASKNGLPVSWFEAELDHGALVPLHFLTEGIRPALVHLAFSLAPLQEHYRYGEVVGTVCDGEKKRIAVVASGDLSHRLKPGAPAGFSPMGKKFDEKLVDVLKRGDAGGILSMDQTLIEEAGECGLRSFVIALGIVKQKFSFTLMSYEGPFGVGYLAAKLV